MKKLVHTISVRVFEKNPENLPVTKNGFNTLLPLDFTKEAIPIQHETAEGFNQKTIHILTMQTSKRRHNRLLLETIFTQLSATDKHKLYQQRETRLDAEGNFYLRLDKPALQQNQFIITEGGDCYHLTIKLAAYPLNQETILCSLEQLLGSFQINSIDL